MTNAYILKYNDILTTTARTKAYISEFNNVSSGAGGTTIKIGNNIKAVRKLLGKNRYKVCYSQAFFLNQEALEYMCKYIDSKERYEYHQEEIESIKREIRVKQNSIYDGMPKNTKTMYEMSIRKLGKSLREHEQEIKIYTATIQKQTELEQSLK